MSEHAKPLPQSHQPLWKTMSNKYEFKWLSSDEIPCLGFNGPFGCDDPTCLHNPLLQPTSMKTRSNTSPNSQPPNKYVSSNDIQQNHNYDSHSSSSSESSVSVGEFHCYRSSSDSEDLSSDCTEHYSSGTPSECEEKTANNPLKDSTQRYFDQKFRQSSADSTMLPFRKQMHHQVKEQKNRTFGNNRSSFKSQSQTNPNIKKIQSFNPESPPFWPQSRSSNTYGSSSGSGNVPIQWKPQFYQSDSGCCVTSDSTASPLSNSLQSDTLPYQCIICSKRFKCQIELNKHIQKKILNPYQCAICGVHYDCKYKLQRHENVHRNVKTFVCKGCGKKLRSINQLSKHYDNCRFKLYIF